MSKRKINVGYIKEYLETMPDNIPVKIKALKKDIDSKEYEYYDIQRIFQKSEYERDFILILID